MLRISVFALMVLCCIVSLPAFAGNVVELEDGTFILKSVPSQVRQELDVTVSAAAKAFPSAWKEVLSGRESVPVGNMTTEYYPKEGLEGLLTLEETTYASQKVVYDRETKTIDVIEKQTVVERGGRVNLVTILGVVVIALMALSYLSFRHGMKNIAIVAVMVVAVMVATITIALAFDFAFALAFIAAAIAAVFAFVAFAALAALESDARKYDVLVSVSIVLVLVIMTTPWW